jgi:Transposase
MWRWSTTPARWLLNAASETARTAGASFYSCSPKPATPPTSRSRWPSRPPEDCWSAACAPPADPYAINPLAVAHYRQPHTVSRAKSDHADATTLANILRTDAQAHRPMPADTPLAQTIAVLARAQQDTVWNRTQLSNQLSSVLREYFPAAIEAFNLKNLALIHR